MIAGHLQIKNDYYYMVLSYTDSDGKRKQPWIPTGLPVKGNKKRAEKMLIETRQTYVPPVSSGNGHLSADAPLQMMDLRSAGSSSSSSSSSSSLCCFKRL